MLQKSPAACWYLGEQQSPVVLPAAILTQDVRVFIHQALVIINGSLLLIAQDCIEFSQDLEYNNTALRSSGWQVGYCTNTAFLGGLG